MIKPKCYTCEFNYKSIDCEPKCNCMCENYDCYKPVTNYDYIMRSGAEELASILLDQFEAGLDCYAARIDYDKKYDELLKWLNSIKE